MKETIVSFLLVFSVIAISMAEETITFKAKDGVMVTADVHMAHPNTAPFIVLFHQAAWSRGEYLEIAPTLNQLGFNCMAVDLRSGQLVNGVRNQTNLDAKAKMKQTGYIDSEPDMLAALQIAKRAYAKGTLLIWGSSYSASLSIKLAGTNKEIVDAVLAFSPGEYFGSVGKPRDYVISSATKVSQPVFITSARSEKSNWWKIYEAIPSESKQFYLPEHTAGNHGTSALFTKFADHKGYWQAVISFLNSLK